LSTIVAGLVLWALSAGGMVDSAELLDRESFRCLAASESMRTIGDARHKRKAAQIVRIERLLTHDLEDLDRAKLKSEKAILAWESEDSRHLRDCAEAYYTSGGTELRTAFDETPPRMDHTQSKLAFKEAIEAVPERLRPHGFNERAALHLAEAALSAADDDRAIDLTRKHLKDVPQGLYIDTLKLVLADALLRQGDREEAQNLYQDVGRMRIGQDAQYARYRLGKLLELNRESQKAGKMLEDVMDWAERGGRQPLQRTLSMEEPKPPLSAR